MESSAEYFPASLPTLQTTKRSASYYTFTCLNLISYFRVILATIKYLAECLCPRCLIQKSQVSQIGSKLDARRRENIRIDNMERQTMVNKTRTWIFDLGLATGTRLVDSLLAAESMVPIRVSDVSVL